MDRDDLISAMNSPMFGNIGAGAISAWGNPSVNPAMARYYLDRPDLFGEQAPQTRALVNPMGAFGTGNPMIDMVSGIAMAEIKTRLGMGNNFLLPPIFGTGGLSVADYMTGQMRFNAINSPDMINRTLAGLPGLGNFATGQMTNLANSSFAQQFYDSLAVPGGSRLETQKILMSRLGGFMNPFGNVGFSAQAQRSHEIMKSISNAFSRGDGTYDLMASSGLMMPEIAEALGAGTTLGFITAEESTSPDLVVGGAKRLAKRVRQARDIFGQDLSPEQALQQLQANFAGINQMDEGRANDFLNKVQGLSRVMQITSKAVAEYLSSASKIFEGMGYSSLNASEMAMSAMMKGNAAFYGAGASGTKDPRLSSRTAAISEAVSLEANFAGSKFSKQRNAAALFLTSLSESDLKDMGLQDAMDAFRGGSLDEQREAIRNISSKAAARGVSISQISKGNQDVIMERIRRSGRADGFDFSSSGTVAEAWRQYALNTVRVDGLSRSQMKSILPEVTSAMEIDDVAKVISSKTGMSMDEAKRLAPTLSLGLLAAVGNAEDRTGFVGQAGISNGAMALLENEQITKNRLNDMYSKLGVETSSIDILGNIFGAVAGQKGTILKNALLGVQADLSGIDTSTPEGKKKFKEALKGRLKEAFSFKDDSVLNDISDYLDDPKSGGGRFREFMEKAKGYRSSEIGGKMLTSEEAMAMAQKEVYGSDDYLSNEFKAVGLSPEEVKKLAEGAQGTNPSQEALKLNTEAIEKLTAAVTEKAEKIEKKTSELTVDPKSAILFTNSQPIFPTT